MHMALPADTGQGSGPRRPSRQGCDLKSQIPLKTHIVQCQILTLQNSVDINHVAKLQHIEAVSRTNVSGFSEHIANLQHIEAASRTYISGFSCIRQQSLTLDIQGSTQH